MDKTLQKASERWIHEGKTYKDSINEWLDMIYVDKKNPDTECPEDTREDMAEYVIEQLFKFNEEGKHKEFRMLFPPDNDPLRKSFDNYGWNKVEKIAMLADGRIIVKVDSDNLHLGAYIINDDNITPIPDLIGFGFSYDKKYFAKVYSNKIDIHEGWDGALVCSLPFPDGNSAAQLSYVSVEVLSTGQQIVLVTHYGIFLINPDGYQLIHGGADTNEDETDDDYDTADEEDEDAPARPAIVPAEARWNADEGEWELGKTNADGNPVGEWKWWLAPKGYLCCHTFYEGEDGNVFSFTRYHEDGTPSRIGKYVNGEPFGAITWIRSEKPTIEQYPTAAGTNVWKTVSIIKNGYTVEEHYYDKAGNEVQEAYVSNTELSDLLKKMGVANRLYIEKDWQHLLAAAGNIIDSSVTEDEDEEQMKAIFYKAYAMYKLGDEEITDEIITLAEEITDLHSFEIWPYLEEFNIIRTALRFAYYVKAQAALNNEEYEDAWSELKEAFTITSPTDTDDMTPFNKMKAFLASQIELEEEEEENSNGNKYLDYPHAAISPDDKYIAVGSQMSPHIILIEKDGKWVETAHIEGRASYPNIACFNYLTTEPLLALGSCHFSQSGTLGVYLNQIEGLEASGWDMDSDALFVIDDHKWIYSMLPSGHGFYLGSNDGYIWRKIVHNKADYIFIGGAVTAMDISPDKQYLVVGTYSGQIVVMHWDAAFVPEKGKSYRKDSSIITNLPVTDSKRYVFMSGKKPVIW